MQAYSGFAMHANRIREFREERGLDPTEFAFRIRRSGSMVSKYETGEVQPPLDVARRIAQVLDTTLDDLFPAAPPTEAVA